MSSINFKQRDISDCGACCLASVAAFHKLHIPVSRIRQLASTNQKGTTVFGMVEAATTLGLDAKGVRCGYENLAGIPMPAIAHVILNGTLHHYIVICEVNKHKVKIMDPADGKIYSRSKEDFQKIWKGILVLLWPGPSFTRGGTRQTAMARFWELLKPHQSVLVQAMVGALVYTLLGLSTAIFVQKIVDHVLPDGNASLLNLMAVLMLTITIVQLFVSVSKSVLILKTGQRIDATLILTYFKHMVRLPQSFFDTMRTGEVLSRINDAVKIRTFINDAGIALVVNVFVILSCTALMFAYHHTLAFLVVSSLPLYYLVYAVTNRINRRIERAIMEHSASLESQLIESISTISTIKNFNLETATTIRMEAKFVPLLKNIYGSGSTSIYSSAATEFLTRALTVAILWTGAHLVLDYELTPGMLLSFYSLIAYFTGPIGTLVGINKVSQNALIAADRLFEILDLQPEPDSRGKVILTREHVGVIRLTNVTFRYGSNENVFENLSLSFSKGAVTAMVGESGSGKSTLIAILQGLYPIHAGTVQIGDYSLAHVDVASLRKVCGIVPQKIDLFAGSVIDNIAIGDDDPDMQRIIHLCADLGILEFIEKFPQGFNTYIGENGATLSGGQKQRLAIARALYRDPEILILDEATSSLDPVAEQHIQRAVQLFRGQDKTVILIAHRLSTVRDADKIIVLDSGCVAEEGTHAELLARRGKYHQLWQYQLPNVDLASFHPTIHELKT